MKNNEDMILDKIDEYEGTLLAEQLRRNLENKEINIAIATIKQMEAITEYITRGDEYDQN